MWLAFAVLAIWATSNHAAAQATTPLAVSRYLKKQGPVIREQIFQASDPRKQLVLWYCIDENLKGGKNEGASNPANVHCHVALFNDQGESWIFASRRALGQGKVLGFANGSVRIESVTYKADDALCCPSNIRTFELTTTDGTFVTRKRAP